MRSKKSRPLEKTKPPIKQKINVTSRWFKVTPSVKELILIIRPCNFETRDVQFEHILDVVLRFYEKPGFIYFISFKHTSFKVY